jgi:rRNA processing protein Gar1
MTAPSELHFLAKCTSGILGKIAQNVGQIAQIFGQIAQNYVPLTS